MVLDSNDPPIGNPAPAPVMEPDTATYGGRECIFCHEQSVVGDDIELLQRCGRQKWCVCIRCFAREVGDDKHMTKDMRREVERTVNAIT